MHCQACNAPLQGERKRRYCDDPTCRRQRAKQHTKAHRAGTAKRQKKRLAKRPNPSKWVDIPESSKSPLQGTEKTHEFRKKIRVSPLTNGLPINIIGGHRFNGAARLPADLLATIREAEYGSFPGRVAKVACAANHAELVNPHPAWLDRIVPHPLNEPEEQEQTVATRNPGSMPDALKNYPIGEGLDIPDFLRRTRCQPFPSGP
jgi:hypothetical protein